VSSKAIWTEKQAKVGPGSWICGESIHVFQYMQKNREVRCNGNHDMHKQLLWYWQSFWCNRNHDMDM
jgi:hypothetical protein